METYIRFMHSEPSVFFLPKLPLQVSTSATHLSRGWNWTGWKLQNQMLSFPQKHPSRRFFLPSFSFDTHSSQLSTLRHQGDLRFLENQCSRCFKTLADGSFFLLSHSIPIPFKRLVLSSLSLIPYLFLSSVFTLSRRRSREPCRVLKKFCHFSWEGLNPICFISDFLSRGNPFLPCFAFAFTFT